MNGFLGDWAMQMFLGARSIFKKNKRYHRNLELTLISLASNSLQVDDSPNSVTSFS